MVVESSSESYCTLLLSDNYLPGAVVLAHSLRDNGTQKQLAALVTLDTISVSTIDELKRVYDHIIPIERIVNRSPGNLELMNRWDLFSTFSKIELWKQTQFSHIVYLDADIVTLRAPDELFRQTAPFAAVPDVGWPDCFNSGVLSLKPNMGDYYGLRALADRGISFDGADQGLMNMHFRNNWERLSFTYNCTPSGNYQYAPAYRHFQSSINVVHYIGHDKPWNIGRGGKGANGIYEEMLGMWWAVYDKHFRAPRTAYISGQAARDTNVVQQYVTGEASSTEYGFSSLDPMPSEGPKDFSPSGPVRTAEPVVSDQSHPIEPTPTGEQRRYSVDWDPAHQPPPPDSKPEAANFPHEVYSMSEDPHLFQPPKYPEPPKDMYYEVPSKPAVQQTRPPPIFPWESKQPKATRVFVEDFPAPTPAPASAPAPAVSEATPSTTTDDEDTEPPSPTTPTQSGPSGSFEQFERSNAWDQIPEINKYISKLPQNARRGKLQILLNNATPAFGTTASDEPLLSPPVNAPPSGLKLTDFPTEIERPSLPVTPAPIRRPSFWGAERDEAGELPGAEGVPSQTDWDPNDKLKELARRQSEVLEKGMATKSSKSGEAAEAETSYSNQAAVGGSANKEIPDREILPSASLPAAKPPTFPESTDTAIKDVGQGSLSEATAGDSMVAPLLESGQVEAATATAETPKTEPATVEPTEA